MTLYAKFCTALVLFLLSASILAEARLLVRVQPANKALKANVEAHIGSLGERDVDALQRFRRVAEGQAEKAVQALGYYQAQIASEVVEDAPPRLIIRIVAGEPVRLREVTLRVEGPASRLE
ncbi:outer membrane protein assembly factor, partial [Pseudomonas sp. CrR25]|nr:outer membrane protein assembly factor [Pseudomonas sp. CrR25]